MSICDPSGFTVIATIRWKQTRDEPQVKETREIIGRRGVAESGLSKGLPRVCQTMLGSMCKQDVQYANWPTLAHSEMQRR